MMQRIAKWQLVFGDSAHAPYGVRTPENIYDLTTKATQRLFDAGCDLVILACNTASAAALRRMFQRELAFRAIGVDVEAQACGGVVDAIEDGDFILAEALVRSHVDALKRKMPTPDAAILGCTHYPLMADAFQKALGDPGTQSQFLTTGNPEQVSARATQFLRRQITFEAA